MATSSSAEDVGSSPQTCCATCGTVFEVASELLGSSDTRVRCGECFAIFDARANLLPGDERSAKGDATLIGGLGGGAEGSAGGRDEERVEERTGERPGIDGSGEPGGTASVSILAGGRAANARHDSAPGDPADLDVTYSDFDLFSEDADLPDVAYFDQTRDTPDFDFDSVALEQDETFSDTLFANDATLDAGALPATVRAPELPVELEAVGGDGPREPLAFKYRDPVPDDEPGGDERAPDIPAGAPRVDVEAVDASARRDGGAGETDVVTGPQPSVTFGASGASGAEDDGFVDLGIAPVDLELEPSPVRRRRWPVVLMLLALVVLLAGLHGWRVRDAPGRDPFVRPLWVAFCRVTGCEVPALAAIDRLRMVKREMFSHPRIDDALVIDVAFRNEAPFEQPYPILVVRLSNPSGRLVARRAFRPEEYLPASGPSPDTATLAAGALLDISLEVTDPGQDASSFEVEFGES